MLVSVDVFSVEDNEKFCLNSLGKNLLTGTSDYLRGIVMAMGDEIISGLGKFTIGYKDGKNWI
ncbi:hypothetical protein [Microcoleus sp. herbarium2]|uniref:hypothetical protein n=1 Tax=Microcoleus sp. herbarium2 TaxID=3055433 RepID=UPI002FD53FFB